MTYEDIGKLLYQNEMEIHEDEIDRTMVDIAFYSPLGEDFFFSLTGIKTPDDFVDRFRDYAESFDAEDHAANYIQMRGTRGIPDSITALIEDADAIAETLTSVARQLEELRRNGNGNFNTANQKANRYCPL